MNLTEAAKLCAIVSQLCPNQKFEEYTPDAWQLVLDDVPIADAVTAVRTVYRDQGSDQWHGTRVIEADDIWREVRRVRDRRIDSGRSRLVPPPEAREPGSAAYRAWLRDALRRLGNGETPEEINGPQPELKPRNLQALGMKVPA